MWKIFLSSWVGPSDDAMLCGVVQLCPTLCDPMDCSPPGSSVHGDSPGKNTGVGYHALLRGIFLAQETNWGLLADRFFTSWATREAPRRWCQISWIVPGMGRGSPDCLSTEGQGIHLRSRILKFRVLDLGPRVGWLWQGLNPRKKQVYPRTEWLAMQLEAAVSASRGNFAPF